MMEHTWMYFIVLDHWADPVTLFPLKKDLTGKADLHLKMYFSISGKVQSSEYISKLKILQN